MNYKARAECVVLRDVRDIMWRRYTRVVGQYGIAHSRSRMARNIYIQSLQAYYRKAAEVYNVRA